MAETVEGGEISPDVIEILAHAGEEVFDKRREIEQAITEGVKAYPQIGQDWLECLDTEKERDELGRKHDSIEDLGERIETLGKIIDLGQRASDINDKYITWGGTEDPTRKALNYFWDSLYTQDPRGEITRKALEPQIPEAPQPPQPFPT